MKINMDKAVHEQYETAENLNIRIKIHEKYSTNRQGFHHWIIENYSIQPGMRILEIGCGSGIIWRSYPHLLAECDRAVLTDISEGMLAEARHHIGSLENVSYETADIQELHFDDCEFDIVIANMMLYHVPNLHQALCEVKRVLKDDGIFYAATFGENGVSDWIERILKIENHSLNPFTLQNGGQLLQKYFSHVEKREYIDSLQITDIYDLIEYIRSFKDMMEWGKYSAAELERLLKTSEVNGVIEIPKEYGMFISKK